MTPRESPHPRIICVGVTSYLAARSVITGSSRARWRPEGNHISRHTSHCIILREGLTYRTIRSDVYPLFVTKIEQVLLSEIWVYPSQVVVLVIRVQNNSAQLTRPDSLRELPSLSSTTVSTLQTSDEYSIRKKQRKTAHVLMEKLLTPMALTLPVSRSSSIFDQVLLTVVS